MKLNSIGVLCVFAIVACETGRFPSCTAAETVPYNTPSTSGPPMLSRAPVGTNSPISVPRLQAALLKDLAQEHSTRAAEAAVSNQVERVKWENELVAELLTKSDRLLKVADRLNAETGSDQSKVSNEAGGADDETEFLARLDDRRLKLSQEIGYALDQTKLNLAQLGTNKVPEDFERIGRLEEENQKYIRNLQKEQFDLDMKRLEYRALRRMLKK